MTVKGGRARELDAVLELLAGARSVVITTHANADGDGAGSEVALAAFLRARGVEASRPRCWRQTSTLSE